MTEPLGALHWRFEPQSGDRFTVRRITESTGFFRPDEIEVAVELVEEHLSRGPSSGYHFVFVEVEGLVRGYTCYGPIPCTTWSFDLYWIAVEQSCRRQGLGRRLLVETERKVRELGGSRIYAETSGRPEYASTREFYCRNGFRREAVLPDFYAPGDDKLTYVRLLGSLSSGGGVEPAPDSSTASHR